MIRTPSCTDTITLPLDLLTLLYHFTTLLTLDYDHFTTTTLPNRRHIIPRTRHRTPYSPPAHTGSKPGTSA